MLYECELSHYFAEVTKNICCAKSEGTDDHSSATRRFKKFCSGGKKLNNQAKIDRPKSKNSKTLLNAIDANLVSSA